MEKQFVLVYMATYDCEHNFRSISPVFHININCIEKILTTFRYDLKYTKIDTGDLTSRLFEYLITTEDAKKILKERSI